MDGGKQGQARRSKRLCSVRLDDQVVVAIRKAKVEAVSRETILKGSRAVC
jgi:hypothetical protein